VRLLGRAITDVGQSRRLRPDSIQRLNLQTFLTVLKRRVQEDSHPDDFVSLSYEQAIGNACSLTGYGPDERVCVVTVGGSLSDVVSIR
jgi:hypothetical protein